jgi:hypothetical protein
VRRRWRAATVPRSGLALSDAQFWALLETRERAPNDAAGDKPLPYGRSGGAGAGMPVAGEATEGKPVPDESPIGAGAGISGADDEAGLPGAPPRDALTLTLSQRERGLSRQSSANGGAAREAALLAAFRGRERPFHLDPRRRGEYVAALDVGWPTERARIVAEADALLVVGEVDWHRDPHSGKRWPLEHFSRVDYLGLGDRSDVKHVWNLSRHQELIALGQARWLTGDERYAEALLARVESWLDANPVELGVNWTVAMEAAQRLVSFAWALHFVLDAPALTAPRLRRWLGSIWHHGRFIAENLEYTARSGNHLLADAVGLLYAGVCFPELVDAAAWRQRGWAILCEQILAQVYPDGVDYEGSTSYHRMVLEFALDALLLARRAGLRVPLAIEERVAAMVDVSRAVTGPGGLGPMIGDADDGFLWRFTPRQSDDHRAAIGLGALVLGTQPGSGQTPVEVLWLGGPDASPLPGEEGQGEGRSLGWIVLLERPSPQPSPRGRGGDAAFPQGGIYRLGDEWLGALVDAGHLGMGPGGHGGHGHLDLLSVVAWAEGQPILVDPGTYVYTGDLEWRRAFRRTAAHNTLSVDGADQAEMTGPWSLDNRATPTLHLRYSGEHFALVDASHSGFERLASPVGHRRQVVLVRGAYLLVADLLQGEGAHAVERWWHLAPGTATPETGLLRAPRATLAWAALDGQRDDLIVGDEATRQGWISRRYGERLPAPVLVQRVESALPLVWPLVVWPGGAAAVRVVAVGEARWRIEHPHGVDELELMASLEPDADAGERVGRDERTSGRGQAPALQEPQVRPGAPMGLVLRRRDGGGRLVGALVSQTTGATTVDGVEVPALPFAATELTGTP